MKLYADYIKEREDADIKYNDKGFMTYKVEKDGVMIIDAYVSPSYRKENITKGFLNEIIEETNSDKLYTTTDENANNWETSEKVILSLGFKMLGKNGRLNYYIKEIK